MKSETNPKVQIQNLKHEMRNSRSKSRDSRFAFAVLCALCASAVITFSGCTMVDVKRFVDEGVSLASEQTYAHLSKPEVRSEIIDKTVERAALEVRVRANREYDALLLDLKTPGLTWRKLIGFLITIGGLLA